MAEPQRFEDEASLYLLGELGPEQRAAFEARMKASPELRSLVRDLQAGAVGLAMASTPRQPPAQMWDRIKDAVAAEPENKIVTPTFSWLRNGWAAAACVLIGWLIYALWTNHSQPQVESAATGSRDVSTAESTQIESVQQEPLRLLPPPGPNSITAPENANPLTKVGEIALLRHQVRQLEDHIAHLSQVMTQQQTLSLESGQVTFFDLVPPGSGDNVSAAVGKPSPELQRALLMAIARELGKMESSQQKESKTQTDDGNPTRASEPAIEFVDVPLDGGDEQSQSQPEANNHPQKQSPKTRQADSDPAPSRRAIPAANIAGKDNDKNTTIVALDSTFIPRGTSTIDVSTERGSQKSVAVTASTTVMSFSGSGQSITLSAGPNIIAVIPTSPPPKTKP